MIEQDDGALRAAIRAVRGGDHNAFGTIVARYQRRMFGLALMMTRDPAGAEEVAQDAFVRAFVNIHMYDERRPFYPWLSTIAVRLAQNWLVAHARVSRREIAGDDADVPDVAADPLAALIAGEDDRRLWRAVAALPSAERTAAVLYYCEDMTVARIASVLGVTSGTIKTLLFRARGRLRRALGAAAVKEVT